MLIFISPRSSQTTLGGGSAEGSRSQLQPGRHCRQHGKFELIQKHLSEFSVQDTVPDWCPFGLSRFEQNSDGCCSFIEKSLRSLVLFDCGSWRETRGQFYRPSVAIQRNKFDVFKMWKRRGHQTWNISSHVQSGGGAEPFGGGGTYWELICDPWVELGKDVMGGVGGQGHCQSWPLERHRRVKWTQAAVADLWRCKKRQCWFVCFWWYFTIHISFRLPHTVWWFHWAQTVPSS